MGGKWCGKQCFPLFGKRRKKERMEKSGENFPPGPTNFFPSDCGEKIALTMELHKCPLPSTLLTNTTAVLESSKKKKKPEIESWRKKERKHFLKEGEKERKEVGDKEIRTNVYGGKKKKKTERASWRKERENESAG